MQKYRPGYEKYRQAAQLVPPAINPLPGAAAGGLFPGLYPYNSGSFLAVDASGNLMVAMNATLYTVKNSVLTDTFLNPTYGQIIALALDRTGRVYMSLPKIAGKQSESDDFVIYKVIP